MRDQEGVRKSWPFPLGGEEDQDVVLDKLLPPLECPIRPALWWSHELERVRSLPGDVAGPPSEEEHAEVETAVARAEWEEVAAGELNVCPVCEVFTSLPNNAVSAHIVGCLAALGKKSDEPPAPAMRGRRRRWRAPKARSLAEIYAVAPGVVAVLAVDDTIEDSKAQEEGIITYKKRKRKRTRTSVESEYEKIKRKKTLKIVKRLIKVCFLLISLFINFVIL